MELQRLREEALVNARRLQSLEADILSRARQVADSSELADHKGAMSLTDLLDARRTLRATQLDAIAARIGHAKAALPGACAPSPCPCHEPDVPPPPPHSLLAALALASLAACRQRDTPAAEPEPPAPILQDNQIRFTLNHPQLKLLALSAAAPGKSVRTELPAPRSRRCPRRPSAGRSHRCPLHRLVGLRVGGDQLQAAGRILHGAAAGVGVLALQHDLRGVDTSARLGGAARAGRIGGEGQRRPTPEGDVDEV
ncbi:hypothetical protein [Variovorax guangxiensis]|uniref:hypothetical protein n=1 Tax=Variovorax guangxiensis TaxID=1775474 RepID=UPI00285A3894|nr:hypothetical protein [Variovorax guangxiensis]MDR6860510.1 hypothetical protein [Variovorax guangxiensis]